MVSPVRSQFQAQAPDRPSIPPQTPITHQSLLLHLQGIVESIVWQKRVREQVGAAFLPAYRAFFTKYEGVPFTKGRRSKYERYSLAEAEAAVQGMLSGAARAPLEGSPQRSGASMSNRLARFRSKLMD